MKVIDLLNKIANGEEVPKKFTYKGYLWEYDVKNKMWFYYFGESKSHRFDRLFYLNMILNDEVEILEEEKKIPEKLEMCYSPDIEEEIFYEKGNKPNHYVLGDAGNKLIISKINEIINYLDFLKSKGE